MEYPIYYRKKGACLKLSSPLDVQIIKLPPDVSVPERYTTAFPNIERVAELLSNEWLLVTADTWEDFYSSYLSGHLDEIINRNNKQKIALP
jgi:hypothetical protein